MRRLYVVAFPKLATGDATRLEALRAAHDPPGHALLPAHFTFVFGRTGMSVDAFEAVVRSAAGATAPIHFRLTHAVASADGDFHYVFVCPELGAAEMFEVHRRLNAGHIATRDATAPAFTPHLTICKTASAERAQEVLEKVRTQGISASGTLTTLTVGSLEGGKFERLLDVDFAGAAEL